jgi:hypothetical protein
LSYKLSDSSISLVAKLLQIGILTGTDIVDHLRTLKLVLNDGVLEPDPEFEASLEKEISNMLSNIKNLETKEEQGGVFGSPFRFP